MPTRMYREPSAGLAVAAATSAAATASMTPHLAISGLDRFLAERAQPAPETLFEVDLRRPTQNLTGTRDVRAADLRIVDGKRLEDDVARRPADANHRLGQLEHRHLVVGVADVHGQVLVARHQGVEAPDQVVDVTERAGLGAVAVDGQRLAGDRLVQELHRRPPVVLAHARAV